jgi:hypothetical protein
MIYGLKPNRDNPCIVGMWVPLGLKFVLEGRTATNIKWLVPPIFSAGVRRGFRIDGTR